MGFSHGPQSPCIWKPTRRGRFTRARSFPRGSSTPTPGSGRLFPVLPPSAPCFPRVRARVTPPPPPPSSSPTGGVLVPDRRRRPRPRLPQPRSSSACTARRRRPHPPHPHCCSSSSPSPSSQSPSKCGEDLLQLIFLSYRPRGVAQGCPAQCPHPSAGPPCQAMSTSQGTRAAWSYTYEKGLVDVMKEHVNIPMYRAQNGWTAEGWRNIAKVFNETFPLAHFTKQQMQEKEKELKRSYTTVRDARKESGVGWNDALSMIIADPKKWEDLIEKNAKVSKFQKKPFPLYEHLASLYEGSIATGDLNFTSTQPPNNTTRPPNETSHSEQSTQNIAAGSDSIGISLGGNGINPFSQIEGPEVQSAPSYLNTEEQGSGSGKKRKQSQVAATLSDYIEIRKIQMEKNQEKLDEKKRKEDEYSVEKCIDIVESMKDLTNEQKADANDLFQSEMNRQIFMMTKNPDVRIIWLKKKISQIHT